MKNRILTIIFLIWAVLWVYFVARGLFKDKHIYDYKALISRSLEGKRAYVTGDRLYEFLTFCNKSLPAGATYEIRGLEHLSLDARRTVYHLYPHLQSGDPDFILMFDCPDPGSGSEVFAKLDDKRYILSARPAARKGF